MSINNDSTENNPGTLPAGSDGTSTGLEGWTKDDKVALVAALREHGSHRLDKIHLNIRTKSISEITKALEYYKNKGVADRIPKLPKCIRRVRKTPRKPRIPLAQWVKFLTDSLSYSELHTETVNAIRLISKFEDLPPSFQTEQIDFKKIYQQLADAMEGKSLTDNRLIINVINHCLMDVVIMSRSFIKPSSFKYLINSVKLKEEKCKTGFHPTKDTEMACLYHLCSQRSYNPLNIPEDYLAPCSQVTVED